jgi:hypothetical protein
MDLKQAIEMADNFARNQLGASSNATEFMTYIASAESDFGDYNMDDALSYGPFQMDPIRYYDTVQDPNLGDSHKDRVQKANKFLQEQGYGDDFDITKLAVYDSKTQSYSDKSSQDIMHDPLINSVITRIALMKDEKPAPTEINEMQNRYFELWKPKVDSPKKRMQANTKYLTTKGMQSNTLDSIKTDNKVFNQILGTEKPLF